MPNHQSAAYIAIIVSGSLIGKSFIAVEIRAIGPVARIAAPVPSRMAGLTRQQWLAAPSANRGPVRRSVLTHESWQACSWERNPLLSRSPTCLVDQVAGRASLQF
jgi:hypothetical protein